MKLNEMPFVKQREMAYFFLGVLLALVLSHVSIEEKSQITMKCDLDNLMVKPTQKIQTEMVKDTLNEFEEIINFEGFNNETGSDDLIVPNLIHYVHLNQEKIEFHLFLSILSVWLNHKPDFIYLHCNPCNYTGRYWNTLQNMKELKSKLIIKPLKNKKTTLFNREPGWIHHLSDVTRLLVLMNYGGIYLDNDMIVINSLNKYRHFEMVLSWKGTEDGIGNQIFIAHKNARFLKAIYDSYRYEYNASQWYYNGGFYPAKILLKHRYLVHTVYSKLGTESLIIQLYFMEDWKEWKSMDSLHLLVNHRYYLDKDSPIKVFNETNIQKYQFTFGQIARDILNRSQVVFFN